VREVSDRERNLAESAIAKLVHYDVEDGAIAHREERLRENRGVWTEAGSLAAREDDGSSSHCCVCRHWREKVESPAYACRPMRIVGKVLYWLAVLAISLVLLVVLMMWFESQDSSEVEGSGLSHQLA
jgi:hypothetical protein